MKRKLFAVIAVLLVSGIFLVGGLFYLENYNDFFYTKIDNNHVRELSSKEEMKYEYTLNCYNKNGKRRKLRFKTSQELDEGIYISLEVRSLGVHKWEAIEYEHLPQRAQEKINSTSKNQEL